MGVIRAIRHAVWPVAVVLICALLLRVWVQGVILRQEFESERDLQAMLQGQRDEQALRQQVLEIRRPVGI